MLKIAALYTAVFKKRVFQRGLDKNGKQFKKYSKAYEELLRDEKKLRERMAAKGLSLEISNSKIALRNPRLTGRTARDLKVIQRQVKKNQIVIGWESDQADIVRRLEEMGRDFVSDIPDNEMEWLVNQLGKSWDRQIRKVRNKTINI